MCYLYDLKIDLYQNSIRQVPRIVKRLRIRGYEFMTAAECVEDEEPHDREDRAMLVNAQNVEAKEIDNSKEITQSENDHSVQQQMASSANSFSYPLYLTFVLAFVGLSGYFI